MIDIEKLRAICQAAGPHSPIAPWAEFRSTITPATVLAMCEMIDKVRSELDGADCQCPDYTPFGPECGVCKAREILRAPSIAARREGG